MISTVDEKIADLRKNQQDTLSRIQQAQATMQELTALAQRQQGALMVLEELSTDSSKDEDDTEAAASTGVVELTWPMAMVTAAYVLGQAYVDAKA